LIHQVRNTLTIAALPERVLAILVDFQDYPNWQPIIRSTEVLERDDEERPVRVRPTTGAMGMASDFEIAVEYFDEGVHWRLVAGELYEKNDTRYIARANASGGTDINCETLIGLKWQGLPQPVVSKFVTKNVTDAMKTVKRLAEATCGQAAMFPGEPTTTFTLTSRTDLYQELPCEFI
jgi:Polyketide cyclase / dehydrase and lipid transport